VQSIRQNDLPDALPDFRNLGVISRILLSVNALALAFALARSREIGEFAAKVAEIAGSLEPILLVVVILLYAGSTLPQRLAYVHGLLAVLAIVLAVTAALFPLQSLPRAEAVSGANSRGASATRRWGPQPSAWYFHLRNRHFPRRFPRRGCRRFRARIRPHFLFKHTERRAFPDSQGSQASRGRSGGSAELFRTVMIDNRQLIALGDELSLCRQYLNLEQLRLGERLKVDWRLDPAIEEALVPPMLLQPWWKTPSITESNREPRPVSSRVRIERRKTACGCIWPIPTTRIINIAREITWRSPTSASGCGFIRRRGELEHAHCRRPLRNRHRDAYRTTL